MVTDYQIQYETGFDTLLIDPAGAVPNVDIVSVYGLHEYEARIGDREFARNDGDIGGLYRAAPRFPRLQLEIRSNTLDQTYYDLVTKVRNIFSLRRDPSDADLMRFKWPGEPDQFIRCRPIRRNMPRDARTEYGLLPVEVQLKAADPRIYHAGTIKSDTGTSLSVTNAGNADAYPIIIWADIANASITNNTNGDVLTITGANVGTGGLVAHMDGFIRGWNNLIIYHGGASGSNDNYFAWQQPRVPFKLSPGVNSLTISPSATVQWRDTWL